MSLPERLVVLVLLVLAAVAPLGATSGPVVRDGKVEASLVAAVEVAAPGVPFEAGLKLVHDPHWHTYWVNPGTGYATSIAWELPSGWTAGPLRWPTPEVLRVGEDIAGYGYEDTVVLPVTLVPPADAPAGEVVLRANVEWLMCKETCVPGAAALELRVRVGERPVQASGPGAAALADGLAREPVTPAGVTLRASVAPGGPIVLEVASADGALPGGLTFFSSDGLVAYEREQRVERSADGRSARIGLVRSPAGPADAAALVGVLAAEPAWPGRGPGLVVDVPLEVVAAPAAGPGAEAGAEAAPAGGLSPGNLLFAFLGGMILNLMPCVFPVLGIKVLGFVGQGGRPRREVLAHGGVFALGVVLSFWVVAGILLALRAAGASLGWGFQLQEPGFVYVLMALLLLLGLNLSGVFEVGGRLVGVGASATSGDGLGASFLSGVLATVVATPCSAPLLGTALAAALTAPAPVAFALFTAMGLGLALPYVVLTAWPALLRKLPRPGAWMETFRQAMAFPVYATVAWLGWVLAAQAEGMALLGALVSLVGLALAAWLVGRFTGYDRPDAARRRAWVAASVVGLGSLVAGWPRVDDAAPAAQAGVVVDGVAWQPWSAEAVAAARAAGKPVYIDFTARWCFTCQTNKKVVFGSAEVLRRFEELGVVAFRADWTRRDPVIGEALAAYGRVAVPTNVVYLPGKADADVLPEVLTPGIVLEALAGR